MPLLLNCRIHYSAISLCRRVQLQRFPCHPTAHRIAKVKKRTQQVAPQYEKVSPRRESATTSRPSSSSRWSQAEAYIAMPTYTVDHYDEFLRINWSAIRLAQLWAAHFQRTSASREQDPSLCLNRTLVRTGSEPVR
ncbi:hypothetical protein M514_24137 [Trichuris suis]|uniref:Uncharacterized protein n=1 Tax=Trichuris suis TaxID=68888 RepID=A0A085N2J7_9BILA|nr:hypothetical protein M514_24137 [Trichuris suis]